MTSRVVENAAPVAAVAAEAPPTFETISSEESFAALEGWDTLVRAMSRPSPFLLHGWVTEWWRHYGEGSRLAVEVAFRGDQLVGALPLITFSLHGLGLFTIEAVQNQDFPEIMGVVMLASFFIIIANLFVDILYAYADPRVRH